MEQGETCPHCGKELGDIEVEFCHWCTEPLEAGEEQSSGP
jgi:predicted amidophosphoribosyltransferase